MATFNGPGIRVLKQYQGQDGKTYVQLDTGETLATDSSDYEDYYAQGLLYGEDERGNFYPQEGAHDLLKQYQQLTQANSFENYMKPYFEDEMTGSIARGLGQSMDKFWEVNPSYKQAYDEQIKQQLVSQFLQNNPKQTVDGSEEARGEYFNRLTRGFPNEIRDYIMDSGNPGVEPGYWADFRRGLYTTVADQLGGGDEQLIKSLRQDPNLTIQERNKAIYDLQMGEYGNLRKAGDKLGLLAPLAVPGKMVQSAYREGYTLDDALAGNKNSAGLAEDILTDPLTYAGIGVAKNISRLPKVADIAEAANRFGEAHLQDAYKFNPFAFKANASSYYRQIDEAGYKGIEDALGIIRGTDGGPASYTQGDLYLRDGRPNLLIEANKQPASRFQPVEDLVSDADNVALSTTPMDLLDKDVNLYKRDWLQGYKPVTKPEVLERDMSGGMYMVRAADEPGVTSVYNPTTQTLMDGRELPGLETIKLEPYQENGEDYYKFFANMPSSKLKAGKAYKALDEFIPVGGKIKEETSLSWDSFQNVLKQAQQDKFTPSQQGFIPMNRMSQTPTRDLNRFRNQAEFEEFFKDLNKQLDEAGFDRVRSVPNDQKVGAELFPLKAEFPNIVLKKNYKTGGMILPDWLFQ